MCDEYNEQRFPLTYVGRNVWICCAKHAAWRPDAMRRNEITGTVCAAPDGLKARQLLF